MPATKSVPKKGVVAKKGVTKKAIKPTQRKNDNSGYEGSGASENEDQPDPASNDSNDMDMELIRAAFACECSRYASLLMADEHPKAAKSKNAKKGNAEFLKQQKALIDSTREQAEAMQAAGNAHL
ncbi:hypothetical protein FRC10_000103 [Ceratobasidium sp. 414]|nr:hypothetical protein FRC10_000103 [Ceratobasidium sp. 414]